MLHRTPDDRNARKDKQQSESACPVSLLGMGRIKSNHKQKEEERGRTALEPDVLERGFKRAALQQFMELHRKAVSGDGGQVGCRQLQPSGKTTKRCKSSELPGLIPAAKLDLSFQEKFLQFFGDLAWQWPDMAQLIVYDDICP